MSDRKRPILPPEDHADQRKHRYLLAKAVRWILGPGLRIIEDEQRRYALLTGGH